MFNSDAGTEDITLGFRDDDWGANNMVIRMVVVLEWYKYADTANGGLISLMTTSWDRPM
jgi:hypothetical protein